MVPVEIDERLIEKHGITPEEYARIKSILGREPNFTELGIFSVMWSEHCSYKNSKPVLKLFPTEGSKILVKAGQENAGAVDIGKGQAVVFKIESHNHPSAVEPFQGAATGVGGILRDIFTMGARPILLMDSLRFGRLESPSTKHLFSGVISGIAHYGNCMGIPTVGGEIYFDDAYEGNPLVNVLALGIIEHKKLVKGAAKGEGNPVYYVGAATGRDGLGGASFASRELTEESHEDRPAVQVGDPFLEKLLMEACLELIETGAVVGMQDMGAAGLTCSTCETAARGNAGIEIDLQLVPRRETGMIPYEVMLSESQERMLIIVQDSKRRTVEQIFDKWDLHAVPIGHVKSGSKMIVRDGEETVADIPAKALTDEGPVYHRELKEPEYYEEAKHFNVENVSIPRNMGNVLKQLLSSLSIASKEWVYEQYDHMVKTDTVLLPGHDAALVRVKGRRIGIAVSTDCNGLYTYLDPYEGGKHAVAEAARNVVCSGAKPVAITNCLNFGSPMKPEIFWQFRRAVEGMRDACLKFHTPVTGGNVSFYNESPSGTVYPTPVVGMVGILDDIEHRIPSFFQKPGDEIFLMGRTGNDLGATQYLAVVHGIKSGVVPVLDLEREALLHEFMLAAGRESLLASAHDVSDGGLAVALAECLFGVRGKPLGAYLNLTELKETGIRADAILFGETASRVLVSVEPKKQKKLERLANQAGIECYHIGRVTEEQLRIDKYIHELSLELEMLYRSAIRKAMGE
ncbi:MAG: phosphoribosylformylglycinamidine synthase subunit PurL [Candidatus Omnitrophica bacterium]|nr:phosphoribosylformylglycinamidine synthase subunit PurL [Candidatus Omnitrophota bacterium]